MVSKRITEEWQYIWNNKRLLLILLLVPLLFSFLFASTYERGQLNSLPTIAFDQDQSSLSRQVVQAFETSGTFEIVETPYSESDVVEQIQDGKGVAGIIIPAGFENNVLRGEPGKLMVFIDGSNIAIVNSALQAANEVTQTISGGIAIQRIESKGMEGESLMGLRHGYRVLYNPGLSYGIFMPLGLIAAVVQQVLLLGICLCIVRFKEENPIGTSWREMGIIRWTYATSVPYFLIGITQLALTFALLINVFHFPFVGSISLFVSLAALFIISLIGLGLFVSAFTPNKLQATQISMLLALLSFPLSGYTWPFIAMPKALDILGHMLPLTYFLQAVQEIAWKGNGFEMIVADLFAIGIITLITVTLTCIRLKWDKSVKARKDKDTDTTVQTTENQLSV